MVPDGCHALVALLPWAAALVSADGRCHAWNARFAEQIGLQDGRTLKSAFSPQSWRRLAPALKSAGAGVSAEVCGTLHAADGNIAATWTSLTPFPSEPGGAPLVLVQADDRSIPEEIAVRPGPTDMIRAKLIDHFPDSTFLFTPTASEREIGAWLASQTGAVLDDDALLEAITKCKAGVPQTVFVGQSGSRPSALEPAVQRVCEIRLIPTTTHRAHDPGLLAIIRKDMICPFEAAENKRLAYRDPLTDLANRRAIVMTLEEALADVCGDALPGLAILFADLDEFKTINDRAGHAAGDEMLVRVARCLERAVGSRGLAGRMGGDEFAAVLRPGVADGAVTIASEFLAALAEIRLPAADQVFTIGASVGLLEVPGDVIKRGIAPAELLDRTDAACLRGKLPGGDKIQIHTLSRDTIGPVLG